MKKEVTFKRSWKHQIIMLSLLFASGGLFAQNHGCNAYFQHQQVNWTDTVNFYNGINPPSATYSWTFGDGGTSNSANPSYVYATTGTYYVCLTVTDSTFSGVCTQTRCDSVTVQPPPPPPTCNANFTWHLGFNANSVFFQGSQNGFGSTYSWNFGDGGTGTGGFTGHTYASAGVYWVCLTVTDTTFSGTCTATWCDSVNTVPPPPPPPVCNAHFTSVANFNGGACFDAAQNASGSYYSWTFGDGSTSTQRDPCHNYTSPGTYQVCLTVVDTNVSGTCSDTQCDSVTIAAPPPPVCNAHFNHYNFNGSVAFVPAQNAFGTSYSWTFGDGGTSTSAHPHHTYATTGTYYVCLTVADTNISGNCTATWCDSVHVGHNGHPHPHIYHCNADFRYFTTQGNDTVQFLNAPNSPITTYSWDFGDGTTGTGANPVHVYPDTIVYVACLTVKDSDSTGVRCSATFCDSIRVGSHQHCNSWYHDDDRVVGSALNSPSAVLYPNPITETATLHIQNTSGTVTFRVFELNGRIAITKQLGNGDYQIDRSNLSAGMYFYDIVDGSNSVIKGKLIIQ